MRQKDWHSHGHSSDPNYNGVVLHAALEVDVDSDTTGLQSGRETPVVSLAPLLDPGLPASPGATPPGDLEDAPSEFPVAPGGTIGMGLWGLLEWKGYRRPQTAAQAGALLDLAGDQRFLSNSRRFQLFLAEQVRETGILAGGLDQTLLDQNLYEGLMEGLGYKNNQQSFLKLAQRAPWAVLGEESGKLDLKDRAAAVQGRLSAVSGLVQDPSPNRSMGAGMALPGGWDLRCRAGNGACRACGLPSTR